MSDQINNAILSGTTRPCDKCKKPFVPSSAYQTTCTPCLIRPSRWPAEKTSKRAKSAAPDNQPEIREDSVDQLCKKCKKPTTENNKLLKQGICQQCKKDMNAKYAGRKKELDAKYYRQKKQNGIKAEPPSKASAVNSPLFTVSFKGIDALTMNQYPGLDKLLRMMILATTLEFDKITCERGGLILTATK